MSTRNPQIKSATATDGTSIKFAHYETSAPTTRRVALLHALAMNHRFWKYVVDALPEDIEVIAIDARGHGQSDKPKGPYTVDLFAGDLNSIFDEAGWESAIVAGASMGGSVSLAFAAEYPDRVDGLVLIDTTSTYGDGAVDAWEERAQKAVDGGMKALIGFQTGRWFSDRFREKNNPIVSECIGTFRKNDVDAYVEACRMLGRCDTSMALYGMNFPCAIVVGEEDYATPIDMAKAMDEALPDSSLTVVDGARHFTPVEVPDVIANTIGDVMSRINRG